MKKIFLLFVLFFGFYINSLALLQDFDNPTHNGLKLGYKDGEANENIESTVNIFCSENGFSYSDSYFIASNDSDKVTYYNLSSSSWEDVQLSVINSGYEITKITCDDGNGQNQGGVTVNGVIGSGALDIITINNGKIYLERDNFFYFFVVGLVIILLFRTVIFIFISSIKAGINLTKGKTYFKK